ncbi:MAG: hypothetical protein NTY48_02490, partial [Candidatus Diapherotrites archaeon]|nr:hypothetical protein [Candidatus Diapherotrites archaeon]
NKYLLEKLSENGKQEARLLKQFLKGINAYGADLKNCSLPGYGVELLIVKYGSFEDVLRAISKWEKGIVITLGNQNEETAKALFSEAHYPLILIDPVDANRNVASALTTRQFERIILAAEMFLQKPSEKFFFPTKVKTWKRKKVSEMLKMKELIAIQATFPKNILPDIMWGQLKRFEKKCAAFLHEKDFKVLRDDVWSDEKKVVFIFELELLNLQKSKKIIGPPAHDIMNIRRFLEGKKILSGPRVEDAHIVIEIERNETSAHKMLEEFIKLEKVGEKKDIRTMLKGAQVLSEKRILLTYKGVFAEYFTIYLEGKESFE